MTKINASTNPKLAFNPHANPHFASMRPMQAPDLGDIHGAFGDSDAADPVPAMSADSEIPPPAVKAAAPKPMATKPSAAMSMGATPAILAADPMSADPPLRKNMHFDETHWRVTLPQRHYVLLDRDYERDYEPAYRFGHDQRQMQPHSRFEDVEHTLQARWAQFRVQSRLSWDEAKAAVHDAWMRISE